MDLIESAGSGGYIISLIERQTRFTLIKYSDNNPLPLKDENNNFSYEAIITGLKHTIN